MGVDWRQVVAGVLTMTMFVMLGSMIKRDHFDSAEMKLPGESSSRPDESKLAENTALSRVNNGPWNINSEELKSCWSKPTLDITEQAKGYITFSLTNGPEYHISQIADVVAVAKYLGAALVLPDIRGGKPGDERSFEDVYDVDKFVQSLDGVVKVVKDLPPEISTRDLTVMRVPNRVTENHIADHIEPTFKRKSNLRIVTYFPSVTMKRTDEKSELESVTCLAMYGTLELRPEVEEAVDSMTGRLRTLSRKSDGRFVAIDLRADMLEKKGCKGRKGCYDAQEIAEFLKKIKFDEETTIYVTQSRWDDRLAPLKTAFPKTYTKEGIIPVDKKAKFLDSEASGLEKVIDFYICSRSDVFVPAISGLFYSNVAGKRIATGKTNILVPANIAGSSPSAAEFISPYVSRKNHLAYSCFC